MALTLRDFSPHDGFADATGRSKEVSSIHQDVPVHALDALNPQPSFAIISTWMSYVAPNPGLSCPFRCRTLFQRQGLPSSLLYIGFVFPVDGVSRGLSARPPPRGMLALTPELILC